MAQTCSVKYNLTILEEFIPTFEERECTRDVYKKGKCFCHYDDPNKPLAPMIEEIEKMSHSNIEFDFSYFVFPKEIFKFPVAIKTRCFFEHCHFHGDVSFEGVEFPRYTSFSHADFWAKADFGSMKNQYSGQTKFQSKARFTSTTFHGNAIFAFSHFYQEPEFLATKFEKGVNFALARFEFKPKMGEMEFRQVEFTDRSNLDFLAGKDLKKVAFRYCNLEGLLISSLPRKEVEIRFENVKKWHDKKKWYNFARYKIRDEADIKDDAVKIIDSYRFLEKYFYDNSDYNLATHFHVGLMHAFLKDKNYRWFSKFINRLYWLISNYGESLVRPLCTLLVIWIVFPFILLFAGVDIHRSVNGEQEIVEVNYDLGSSVGQVTFSRFWSDYSSAFWLNTSLSTIDRNNILAPKPDSFQRALTIVETVLC